VIFGEFSSDFSFKICDFCLSYVLSNVGMKNVTHMHMCVLYQQFFIYFSVLEIRILGAGKL
jgi:hypothetical protein